MKKVVVFAAVVVLVGLLGGCSKSSSSNCSDYIGKICDKLSSCGVLSQAGISKSQCAANLKSNLYSANDTQTCKDAWDQINAAACSAFF